MPHQSEALDGAPMRYAPHNENGVVYLFATLARRWRLRIEEIRPGFPDCIAYQKSHGKEKRVRIEFEYKSRNFQLHRHSARKCDWVVCWEHNWPDAPKGLQIIELRREFGLGFNVWLMAVRGEYKEELAAKRSEVWSVPSQAHAGDLILFYFTKPDMSFPYLYRLTERAQKITAGWKAGKDHMARVQRICHIRSPLFLEDLKRDPVLRTANFVRGSMQGRPNATEYWPYLYDRILRRNPGLARALKKYASEAL